MHSLGGESIAKPGFVPSFAFLSVHSLGVDVLLDPATEPPPLRAVQEQLWRSATVCVFGTEPGVVAAVGEGQRELHIQRVGVQRVRL